MTLSLLINGNGHAGAKQSLLGTIINNNQYIGGSSFRIRRNKWSIIKLILMSLFVLYILLYIKSRYYSEPQVSPTNIKTISDSWTKHAQKSTPNHEALPLQASRGPTKKSEMVIERQIKSHDESSHSKHSSIKPIHYASDKTTQSHKKKRFRLPFDVRRKRLDAQLNSLMPIQSGWGELGKGVVLTSEMEKEKAAEMFKQGAYNVYVSDRISPNRTLKRVSAKECYDISYNVDDLPNVSVIIIFTDEIFSALVRTVWSVINRTPKRLLKEIILVDDHSEKPYLKQTLVDYIDIYWNTLPRYHNSTDPEVIKRDGDLVKLIRFPERRGLIKARLEGAQKAVGDVLLFLDSHCEVTETWIEPLVYRIKQNRRVFICPVIDIINDKTLEYNAVDPYYFQIGGFDWSGHFTWINRDNSEAKKQPTKPVKTPTMAGGLFAVDREYFFEVGSYDENMKIWGGENLEISFRVWQCGGRVEIHPCSHVGHIFRDFHPYSFNGMDSHGFNTLRTVLAWMDEYSRYFFMSRPDLLKLDAGNLTSRQELRKRLQCKSFEWYLKNVYDDRKFIYDQGVQAYGYIKNDKTNLCIDTLNRHEQSAESAGLYTCEKMNHPLDTITNQLFSYTKQGQIRREESCLSVPFKYDDHMKKKRKRSGRRNDDKENHELDTSSTTNLIESIMSSSVDMYDCIEQGFDSHSSSQKKSSNRKMFSSQKWRYEPVSEGSNHRLIINVHNNLCLTAENSTSYSDLIAVECDWNNPNQYWEFEIHTTLDK